MGFRAKGFTLIEMTIVIVILAIISAISVPKFVNLSGDAKKAKIASVAADLRTAINLIYYKSLLLGLDGKCYDKYALPEPKPGDNPVEDKNKSKDQSAVVEGYLTCWGYPIAYQDSIIRLLSLDEEFTVTNSARTYPSEGCKDRKDCEKHRVLIIAIGDQFTHQDIDGAYCQVLYQPNSSNKVVVFDSAC
ncbi:type II secretion system protein [Moritella marina]|uniref:type II secretion system protein n=1 Tax=Moritella marina TaxID=90736 RepID=UPI003704399E